MLLAAHGLPGLVQAVMSDMGMTKTLAACLNRRSQQLWPAQVG